MCCAVNTTISQLLNNNYYDLCAPGQFTLEKIKGFLQEQSVYLRLAEVWDTLSATMDIPLSQRDRIRHSPGLDKPAKLDRVLQHVINLHPYGSWRLLIWALDEMGCKQEADAIRACAEPVGE